MNIMHLRYAIAIEKTGSVTKAAEQLFVAQPNISRAIRELEATVGISLFRRTSFGMIATEEGRKFLENARHIVQEIDDLKSTYDRVGNTNGCFSLCSHGEKYVASAFKAFLSQCDEEKFIYVCNESDAETVIAGVAESRYDLGVFRFPSERETEVQQYMEGQDLSLETLFETSLVYIISEASPLAKRKTISEEDLSGKTKITNGAVYVQAERSFGRQIYISNRENGMDVLREMPDAYMVSAKEKYFRESGLVQIESAEEMRVRDVLVSRKKHVYSEQEKMFLAYLSNEIEIYK